MAKTSIGQITTAQTFQAWLDKTNQIVTLLEGDVMTASALGDTTTGNATLVGSFTANTVIAFNTLRADAISPKVGSSSIAVSAPVSITSTPQDAFTLTSSNGPRVQYSSGTVTWRAGFLSAGATPTDNFFTIDTGTGTPKLTLSPSGNLNVAGTINAVGGIEGNTTGNVTGNVSGNVTGDVSGNVTGNVTGNVSGDLTGDVFASNGTTKILENGNGSSVPATFTGNVTGSVTVPSGGTLNASDASSVSLPTGFGLIPTGGIIMWSGLSTAIPTGWALCDGDGGRPDLRGKFVVGFDPRDLDYNTVRNTGGEKTVTLTEAQMPAHTHSVSGSTNNTGAHTHTADIKDAWQNNTVNNNGSGTMYVGQNNTNTYTTSTEGAHEHTVSGTAASRGGGEAHENRPPYYVVCFIIKT